MDIETNLAIQQMHRKPTPEQLAIFNHRNSGKNLIVLAGAGTGKTTTILDFLHLLPQRDPETFMFPAVTIVAFNKNIVEVLKPRVPSHMATVTYHSLGRRALVDAGIIQSNNKPEFNKVSKLVYSKTERNDPDVRGILQLVSLAKSVWPMIETEAELQTIADFHELDLATPRASIRTALWAFQKSCENTAEIDFDDMLFLPVLLGCRFSPQDWVFVDEAQDTNNIQLEILEHLRYPKYEPNAFSDRVPNRNSTRYVFVGDPNQAIYGFRGANADSMDRIAQRFSCDSLPLSVSWRCAQSVVAEANKVLRKEFF